MSNRVAPSFNNKGVFAMRDLEDHYGPLVISTDNTGRSQDPAVALVPVY